MQSNLKFTRLTVLSIGIAAALTMGQAWGAAFQLKENSAKGLGRAFAGSTSAPDDASVIATNPASMRLLDGQQFQADLSLVRFSAKFSGSGNDALGRPMSGGNGGDAGTVAPIPAMFYHLPIGEKWHFGTSFTAPYGFATEYNRQWAGRYSGVKTELKAMDLNFAVSYDVNPYVSFGGSVFVQRLDVELTNAVDFGAILASQGVPGYLPGNADGFSQIKADNYKVGYTIGGLFSPVEGTNIGISYRSAVKHKVSDATAKFTVPGDVAGIISRPPGNLFTNTDASASLILPAQATLSVTHRINDKWSVMGDVSRTAWSKFDRIIIDFHNPAQSNSELNFSYRDTTFVSLGADYRVSDTLTLRGGIAYDQTPTTNEHRDIRVPDNSRKWVSLGLSWQPSPKAEYSLGYTHLFASDPSVNIRSATGSTMQGDYKVVGDILAASINYKF